jgi:hypothetical protein
MTGNEAAKEMGKAFINYEKANGVLIQKWQEIIFLSPRWWIGVFLGIFPWILWWMFHNKKYTGDLVRVGFFMSLICIILDGIGVQLGLWMYVYDIFPFIPGYIPWDLTFFPIMAMVMVEVKPEWSPFLKAVIIAAFCSFIGEPLAEFSKIYEPIHWKPYYSFPIYIIVFLLCEKVARSKIFNSRL